jgi:hypothetical protein
LREKWAGDRWKSSWKISLCITLVRSSQNRKQRWIVFECRNGRIDLKKMQKVEKDIAVKD